MQTAVLRLADSDSVSADEQAERVALRRRVLDWRDHWSIEIEQRIARLCREGAGEIAVWAKDLSAPGLAAARTGLSNCPALPKIVADAATLAEMAIGEAREELAGIVAHHLEFKARIVGAGATHGFGTGDALALGKGVGPFAAAGALLTALPGLATTTTAAMFGLVTTSTVSLPILAAGAASVGALGYFGVVNFGEILAEQRQVLVKAVEAAVEARLLAPEAATTDPSLVAQIHQRLITTADELVGAIA